jgi:hypothetical protein
MCSSVYIKVSPEAVDGEGDFKIWREVANILKKESRAAEKGISSDLETTLKWILKKYWEITAWFLLAQDRNLWLNFVNVRIALSYGTE